MGLLRIIIIIAVIYYGLKLLVRYLFPYLLKIFINKQQKKYNSGRQNSYTKKTDREPEKKFSSKEKLGDYVEYEEIED